MSLSFLPLPLPMPLPLPLPLRRKGEWLARQDRKLRDELLSFGDWRESEEKERRRGGERTNGSHGLLQLRAFRGERLGLRAEGGGVESLLQSLLARVHFLHEGLELCLESRELLLGQQALLLCALHEGEELLSVLLPLSCPLLSLCPACAQRESESLCALKGSEKLLQLRLTLLQHPLSQRGISDLYWETRKVRGSYIGGHEGI